MNKKDCELIGYILASHQDAVETAEELIRRLISLDVRIQQEYLLFSENRIREEKILELQSKKLEDKFGKGYGAKKACSSDECKKARIEAEKEIDSMEFED